MSTPATAATPPAERDAQLLNLGQQCSHASCLLVDFLPFKCHHCSQLFCQEHFRVEAHQCAKYDESKHNRVAPNCPLCNKPVAVAPGQDPNIRMDHHLDRECSVVVGQKKASSTPRCKKATCNKVLFAPIRCDKCREQFCPAHRFPGDHICSAAAAASNTSSTTRPTNPRPNLPNFASSAKELNTKATAARTAAFGAIKKSASATTAAVSSAVNNASTSASGSGSGTGTGKGQKVTMPFNKTDRPFASLHTASLTRSRSPTVVSAPAVTASTSISTTANADNVTNATTTATTTANDDHMNDEPPNVPPPAINAWSFMPPPIFATA